VSINTLVGHPGRPGRRILVGEGEGSAFIYDPAGLILTNHHVVEDAAEIRVVLGNDRQMRAKVVGIDAPTDIAVLRVQVQGLPFLPLGDSDTARVGDWVVAIGNPFGLAHTVSAGIVSAKERTGQDVRGLGDETGYYNFIQTDASINPGNSGGPLIDLSGRVIGINTAIRAQANSIGFAIPINMVKELLPRLLRDGKVRRSAIGVTVSEVGPDEMRKLGVDNRAGAVVRRVLPGSSASRAGIQPNDVIVSFRGEPVSGPERLRWKAGLAGVGRRIRLGLIRRGQAVRVEVVLGELSAAKPRLP
jgi:serine protease Do